MNKTFQTYIVEFKAQYGRHPGYGDYVASSKADAIKKARSYYNSHCKDRADGRMTYRVVSIDDQEV